jgi:hypothetical protein
LIAHTSNRSSRKLLAHHVADVQDHATVIEFAVPPLRRFTAVDQANPIATDPSQGLHARAIATMSTTAANALLDRERTLRPLPMVAERYPDFANRLNLACEVAGVESGRHRVSALATAWKVNKETARKWVRGLALPEQHRMQAMAAKYSVSYEWLSTGRGPMIMAAQRLQEPMREPYGPLMEISDLREMLLLTKFRELSERKRRALLEIISSD